MNTLRRLWQGDVPLPEAFWTWGVLVGLVVNGITTILKLALIMTGYPVSGLVLGYGLSVPYNIAVAVGVWRSAGRYQGEGRWGDAARIAIVVLMVAFSVT